MNTIRICPVCRKPLPLDAPEGLCPACLLQPTVGSLSNPPVGSGRHTEPLDSRTFHPVSGTVRYFGDYELLGELAQGGMGVVYRARQVTLNREVALKMILTGTLASVTEVQRFKTEAEAVAKLDHPNIVPIFEIGEHEGRHYFSMKFVPGGNLAELTGAKPLEVRRAATLVARVARAVHYAHQRGILHRDIKPRNILLDDRGEPLLTDFGLAKLVEKQTDLTQSLAVMGSASYMAPEQAAGRAKEVTTAADVYALGAVLYEALTGQAPFRADSVMATLRKVVEEEPEAPGALNPAVDRDLEIICLKCLEKDPGRRFTSADALADELERWLRHEPILSRPASVVDRARKWVRRKPAQVAMAGIVAVAGLVFIVGIFVANRGLNQRYWQSLLNLARAERLNQNRAGSLQSIAEAARLRTGMELRSEAIQTLAQPGVRLERRIPYGKEAWFTLSADGRLLMAAGEVHSYTGTKPITTPKIKVWETDTGKLVRETPWEPLGPLPAFSPDSRLVALPRGADEIALWEPRSGRELNRWPGWGAMMFSPDSRWLAMAASNSVKVVRCDGAKEEKLRESAVFLAFAPDGQALVREGNRIVKWDFQGTGAIQLTPAELNVIAVNARGTVAALWRKGGGGSPTATSAAQEPVDPPGSIVVFDLANQKQIAVLPTMRSTPVPVRFSADGRLLAFSDMTGLEYAAGQQAVRIWDVEEGRYRRSLTGISPKPGAFKHWRSWWGSQHWDLDFDAASPGAIFGGEFVGDGSLFAAVTGLNELYVTLWSTETGEPVGTLPKSAEFAASADGRWVASVSDGTFLHYANGDTYAIDSGDVIIAQTAGVPSGAQELPKGAGSLGGAAAGTGGLFIQLWSVASGVPTLQTSREVHTLAFSRDGHQLTAGGRWNQQDASRVWNVSSQGDRLTLHAASAPGLKGRLYFNDQDQLWEAGELAGSNPAEFGTYLRQLAPEHRDFPNLTGLCNGGPVFKPDGRQVLVAAYGYGTSNSFTVMSNQTFYLWDLATMKVVQSHSVASSDWSPGVSAFSPDGRYIATSAFVHQGLDLLDATTFARVWHAEHPPQTQASYLRARLLASLMGSGKTPTYDEYSVSKIAFTPDGKRIVSVANEHLTVREAATGVELGIGRGHEGYIQSLAVSPDGRYALTGGLDRTIRVWELPGAREVARWEAHDSAVTALAFSTDGFTLASGSLQGTLKLWNLKALRRELKELGLDW